MKKLLLVAVALTALSTAPAVAQGCGMMGQGAAGGGGDDVRPSGRNPGSGHHAATRSAGAVRRVLRMLP
jgi:hypothetical protein